MNKFKSFMEWNAFGVCSAIGNRMGIATSKIRPSLRWAPPLLFTWCWLSGAICGSICGLRRGIRGIICEFLSGYKYFIALSNKKTRYFRALLSVSNGTVIQQPSFLFLSRKGVENGETVNGFA